MNPQDRNIETRPTLSVYIIASHRLAIFQECIISVVKALPENAELVIVLNGSQNEKVQWLYSLSDSRIRYIEIPKTCVSFLRNRAFKDCKGEIIYFLDDDVLINPRFFNKAFEKFSSNPKLAILGGPNLTPQHSSLKEKLFGAILSSPFAAPFVYRRYSSSGSNEKNGSLPFMFCNLALKRKNIPDYHRFKEGLYPNDETYFLHRSKRLKLEMEFDTSLDVYHFRRNTLKGFLQQIIGYGFGRGRQTILDPLSFPIPLAAAGLFFLVLLNFPILYILGSYAGWILSSECRKLGVIGIIAAPILTLLVHLSYLTGLLKAFIYILAIFFATIPNFARAMEIKLNNEVVAEIKLESAELLNMKLKPGGIPLLKASLGWLEAKQQGAKPATLISKNENSLEYIFEGKVFYPKGNYKTKLNVSYDKKLESYSYEFDSGFEFEPQSEVENPLSIEYNYLFPLVKTTWEIFNGTDGVLYKAPIRNDWDDNPKSLSLRPYYYNTALNIRQHLGDFIIRKAEGNTHPAIEFFSSEKIQSACATCAFSHETHLGFKPESTKYHAHFRFVGYSNDKTDLILKKATLLQTQQKSGIKILSKKGLNSFDKSQQVNANEPLDEKVYAGTYQVEDDKLVLKNHDWIRFETDDKSNCNHLKMKVLFEKKENTESLTVRSSLGAFVETQTIRPKNRKWMDVQLPLKFSKGKNTNSVELYFEGTGTVWIDDVLLKEPLLASHR